MNRSSTKPQAAAAEIVCPMCGTISPDTAHNCPNCGENLVTFGNDLWRQGDEFLVMHKSAELPFRCVKSNQPCTRKITCRLTWNPPVLSHPGWIFPKVVGLMMPYVIAVGILRKTATIRVGLSNEWIARRRMAIIIGWVVVLSAVSLFVAAVITAVPQLQGLAALLMPLLIPAGCAIGIEGARIVKVEKFEGDYVWLNGCDAAFLAGLPEWPGEAP